MLMFIVVFNCQQYCVDFHICILFTLTEAPKSRRTEEKAKKSGTQSTEVSGYETWSGVLRLCRSC